MPPTCLQCGYVNPSTKQPTDNRPNCQNLPKWIPKSNKLGSQIIKKSVLGGLWGGFGRSLGVSGKSWGPRPPSQNHFVSIQNNLIFILFVDRSKICFLGTWGPTCPPKPSQNALNWSQVTSKLHQKTMNTNKSKNTILREPFTENHRFEAPHNIKKLHKH